MATINGTNGDDSLVGTDGDDIINGFDGSDDLFGLGGSDILNGGVGFFDQAHYQQNAAGIVVVYTGEFSGTVTESSTEVDTFTGIEGIVGTAYADSFTNDGSSYARFRGLDGADTYIGNVNGIDEIDFLRDANFGGMFGVTVNLAAGTAIDGFGNAETLSSIENVRGTDSSDLLIGNADDNVLDGRGGSDVFRGFAGNDTFVGGGGDTADYSQDATFGATHGIRVNQWGVGSQGGIAPDSVLDSFGFTDSIVDVRNITATGFADEVYGGTHDNILILGAGDDFAFGFLGDDELYGEAGDDILVGGAGADILNGGAGNDTASYEDSTTSVAIDLGNGNAFGSNAAGDTFISIENLTGTSYSDILIGNAAANVLRGENGLDLIRGFGGNDHLFGGNGNDALMGDTGNDVLIGGSGADATDGGDGSDTASYEGSTSRVAVDLRNGNAYGGDAGGDVLTSIENLTGSSYFDTLIGNGEANVLRGENGFDTLRGFAGNDQLFGGNGNDSLIGDAGFDTLTGGAGNDTLTGGVNGDTFIFANGFGKDVITDFEALNNFEKIDLSAVTAITDFADLAANHLTQSGADAVITAGVNTITLNGVAIADLDAGDFVF